MNDSPLQVLVCLTTVSSVEQADELAKSLIDQRLAACVQIDGPIRSHYRWEDEHRCDEEFRLTIKTQRGHELALRKRLHELHAYDEPQIITLQSFDVAPGYAKWVQAQTGPEEDE